MITFTIPEQTFTIDEGGYLRIKLNLASPTPIVPAVDGTILTPSDVTTADTAVAIPVDVSVEVAPETATEATV